MPMPRKALGKGLEALIPSSVATSTMDPAPPATAAVRDVPIEDIGPNPYQPRTRFDDESIQELASSIKATGVLQPVLVRLQVLQACEALVQRADVGAQPAPEQPPAQAQPGQEGREHEQPDRESDGREPGEPGRPQAGGGGDREHRGRRRLVPRDQRHRNERTGTQQSGEGLADRDAHAGSRCSLATGGRARAGWPL